MTRTLAVLGSTGSIGAQALEVAGHERDRLEIVALASGSRLESLLTQVHRHQPRWIGLERAPDPAAASAALRDAAPRAEVVVGPGAAARVAAACGATIVLNGVVGAAGLAASLATLGRGARLALANKESLVIGGPLVRAALQRGGGELLPVDSEHSAALQCLGGRPPHEVATLTITASGGPLLRHPEWRRATREEVLRHPVWPMGARITTDSATLFNKGLELIEAHHLFDLGWDQLAAVIHPGALVHAVVTFRDGSGVVQVARPDMRLPIQLALSWPERWGPAVPALDPLALTGLAFEPIAPGRWPAYELALAAGRAGGTAPCALNAADEVAVAAFLEGVVTLGEVPGILSDVLERHACEPVESPEQLARVDAWARETARTLLAVR